jgi:hypothetical protein
VAAKMAANTQTIDRPSTSKGFIIISGALFSLRAFWASMSDSGLIYKRKLPYAATILNAPGSHF